MHCARRACANSFHGIVLTMAWSSGREALAPFCAGLGVSSVWCRQSYGRITTPASSLSIRLRHTERRRRRTKRTLYHGNATDISLALHLTKHRTRTTTTYNTGPVSGPVVRSTVPDSDETPWFHTGHRTGSTNGKLFVRVPQRSERDCDLCVGSAPPDDFTTTGFLYAY